MLTAAKVEDIVLQFAADIGIVADDRRKALFTDESEFFRRQARFVPEAVPVAQHRELVWNHLEINLMLLKNLLKELKMMRGHRFFLVLQAQVKLSQWRKLLN